eukprot:TCONS_00000783-protein
MNLEQCLQKIKWHIVERGTFATLKSPFSINLEDIPPLIPPKQRKHEYNTESQKRSIYLKENDSVEGDVNVLSNLMEEKGLTIDQIEKMPNNELLETAKACSIPTQSKSQDMLRLDILKLYSSILVGKSSCHKFVKSPGHTGGFYHVVCAHGTTVCSKFMVLTESVRDAADLYLSLNHPPVLFVCDTPCTFAQHISKRCPELAKEYWGEMNGCFEKPVFDKEPSNGMDVPELVPPEFRSGEGSKGLPGENLGSWHPLTGKSRRYVCGDRFHNKKDPHVSPLCRYHDIDLCAQSKTVKTSYQESLNNKKNTLRNRSSCNQTIMIHIYYNFLMNFYENEKIVKRQMKELRKSYGGKDLKRDKFMRFVCAD